MAPSLAQQSPQPTTPTAPIRDPAVAAASPWGPDDEIGALNRMTPASRAAILARIDGAKVYDLAVDYFIGMPSWSAIGDPRYQYWLTHTPEGTRVDDPLGVGPDQNATVAYTGDAISMYTHMGTHIDALNHFGLHGKVWNRFAAKDHLGDQGWRRTGAEKLPPIIARGVLLDVVGSKGLTVLPPSYQITVADLEATLTRQGTKLAAGDVVLVRTGRMSVWPDDKTYGVLQPGLSLEAARWLVERHGAMVIGADSLSLEAFPSRVRHNWIPVHTYLLAEQGVPIIEVLQLDALARDGVHEFAFLAASLKLRGASAAPFRPLAFPLVR